MPRHMAPKGYYAQADPPSVCLHCNTTVDRSHWREVNAQRTRTGKSWDCLVRRKKYAAAHYQRQMADPAQRLALRTAEQARYIRSKEHSKWAAYRSTDKKNGRSCDLPWDAAYALMISACHYCGGESGGLDRRDSARGHDLDNVVPACWRCNSVLTDLPAQAKDLLAPGLRAVRESRAFGDWQPPLSRNRK